MTYNDCMNLIRKFITAKLDGDIHNLKNFDLLTLNGDPDFGCPGDDFFDCDVCRIMKAIYIVLWGDVFPNLTFENIGSYRLYIGNTIDGFHNLFAKPNDDFLLGASKSQLSDKVKDKIYHFFTMYHTVGNMILQPDLRVDGKSLNTYLGIKKWCIGFDLYMDELIRCLCNVKYADRNLKALVERNEFFFKEFQNKEGFQNFCSIFWLERYVDEMKQMSDIFAPHFYYWQRGLGDAEYEAHVERYLNTALKIIEYRADKMIEKLEILLNK